MKKIFFNTLLFLFSTNIFSQKDVHKFTILNKIVTTPVKNQGKTGTCWAFATTSFVETELIRLGYGITDLSEMFVVKNMLLEKAEKYIRYHGKSNFGTGGQAHDVLNSIKRYGMVPEKDYSGINYGFDNHNHGEMQAVLNGMLDAVLLKKSGKLTSKWKDAVESVLNTYLGKPTEKFTVNGVTYTPKSYAKSTGFNPDNYIELTSYLDSPYYEKYNLQLPDNWTNSEYYNVPINDLVKIVDNSIKNGYSVCWDGDTGKDNFLREEGYAVIPQKMPESNNNSFEPEKEKIITQEMRQEAFNNFDVTDDHLMHIVGIAKNQNGTKFYYTKNSWGTDGKKYGGYWYLSESYIKLKTVAIMVNKESIPANIRKKLKL